jgi:hypothetical protein
LWYTYARSALTVLAGTRVMVTSYEALVERSRGAVPEMARWLDDMGMLHGKLDEGRVARAVASISDGKAGRPTDEELSEPFGEATDALRSLEGAHALLPELLLPEPPRWATDAILQRRDYEDLYRRYMRYIRWRRRIPLSRYFSGPSR